MRFEIDRVDGSLVVPVDKQRSCLHGRQLGDRQSRMMSIEKGPIVKNRDTVELKAKPMTDRSGWEGKKLRQEWVVSEKVEVRR